MNYVNSDNSDNLNSPITYYECKRVTSLAKSGKAIGIDCLPNEVFKNDSSILLLGNFFQKRFSCHCVPSLWSKSIIKPIPKNTQNDPRVPLNYRGISLIPTMCKLYTNILNKRIIEYLDINNLTEDEQNGFWKDRSCEDHIYSLTSIIRNRKNMGLDTFTCFVDMAKAFDRVDRVNRDILFVKLANIGISGDILESIKALYADCRASINVNDDYTDFFGIMSGVKHGDVISPTLFSIFINDLVKGIKELNEDVDISPDLNVGILLFADDIVLLALTELNLQSMLDYLHSWCNKNMMDVNINKTKVVHFRKSNTDRTEFNFKLDNNDIEIRGNYKYLGAWGAKCFPKSDTLHNRIIRFFLGVHKCTSNVVIQGYMGWIPPSVRRQLNCLRLWNRFLNMNENRLTRRIFQWDYSKCRNNLCYDVKRILKSIGWGNMFTTALTDPANSTVSVEAARDKLMLNFKAKWGTMFHLKVN